MLYVTAAELDEHLTGGYEPSLQSHHRPYTVTETDERHNRSDEMLLPSFSET
ncbi:MAG: hypothetical protein SOX82_03495 [Eubacteriales bacterium]|nr:hypothetical protein [Eubacteriales bacterium]MDY4212740.1 hypothetical protein [Eubacteriales bacterium]